MRTKKANVPSHITTEDVRHCVDGTCTCNERAALLERLQRAQRAMLRIRPYLAPEQKRWLDEALAGQGGK